jgi:ABC-2 type transport system permease protein
MSSKGITEKTQPESPPRGWSPSRESAPSILREEQPTVARIFGLVGLMLITIGCAVLATVGLGYSSRIPPVLGAFLLFLGLTFLLLHAARDADMQIRRAYGILAYLCLAAGAVFILVALAREARFLWFAFLFLGLGLLFFLPFTRNETEPRWRDTAERVLGVIGGLLAVGGFIYANVAPAFLLPYGLMIILLGFFYLWAFTGLRGTADDLGYRAALAIGVLGGLAFLVALGRSVLPPLIARWGSGPAAAASSYFASAGALLMGLSALYIGLSAALCSDNRLVVMTRRELAGYFYSPIAYIVLFGLTIVGWGLYIWFVLVADYLSTRQPLIEPIIKDYIFNLLPVVCAIFAVPVITMRLLSEEQRTGTLEVLLTAPLGETPVVLSKFFAALIFFMVVWIPWGLFLVDLRIEAGQPFDYRPLFSFFTALFFSGAGFVAMGVFFSSPTRNQIGAAILTFMGMMLFLCIFLLANFVPESSYWKTVLTHMSFVHFWRDSLEGRVALRSILFHASAAIFWLFLTVKVLEARKWK